MVIEATGSWKEKTGLWIKKIEDIEKEPERVYVGKKKYTYAYPCLVADLIICLNVA